MGAGEQQAAACGRATSCEPQDETAAPKLDLKKRDHGYGWPEVPKKYVQ
jgi:hypothetical protein